ncbi:MAG: RNA methyltransferase [Rhodoferax sp.]|uniref:RNA methyltransferase n=1 Tax=Rhodoferax sp. TaxID=50421 RepID=UPI0013FEC8E4|nr:RNA methyltransferase [Rhodoferax sp.]NDP37267.1 RNA methyltransferase [Rhodoferax sp.]
MQTRFILINTSHAGNVGAAARAMKTMGFSDMVLVAPRWANVLNREETIQRASGALDVLKNARIVATLDEALDGMTHLCATAMTPRDFGPPTVTPREHFESLIKKELLTHSARGLEADLACKNKILPATAETDQASAGAPPQRGMGFLFGCERFGMRNEDVYRCHVALSIPSDPQFGSLNLGAAVQVIAYEWRLALGAFAVQAATLEPVLADAAQVAGMLGHLEQSLQAIGFLDPQAPKKLMPRLNQLFNRAGVTQEEVHILRGIAKAILQNAARPDALAPATACVQG